MSNKPTAPPIPPEPPEPSAAAAPVANKRTPAAGAIPKHVQSWIFLGIIAVAAVGLWFSGIGHKGNKAGASATTEQAKPVVGGLSPEEVQKRLQESEGSRRTEAANFRPTPLPQPSDAHLLSDPAVGTSSPPPAAPAPTVDPIAEEERKRDYAGRYASNIALSYRNEPQAGDPALRSTTGELAWRPAAHVSSNGLPTGEISATSEPAPVGSQPQEPKSTVPASRKNTNLNAATGKNHVIFEGTVLESVLVNRLNGDFAGPVICQTTNDIYSHDHTELLIPAGSRLLGETKKTSEIGQERLAVIFHRLIMPDGYAVDLDQAPGLNQIGETALHDKVNNHYFKIFGASIAVGAIAGLASIGTNNSAVTGLPTSNLSAYREGVTASLSQSSLHILDRFLNIPPTITIREGHRVRIYLMQDLLVPAYAQHKMPSDL